MSRAKYPMKNPYAAYRPVPTAQSAREQEAMALRLAARRLSEASNRLERNRALNINHEMWSILFRELNSPLCPLPEVLKWDCVRLAFWSIDYSTKAVLSELSLDPLIEINDRVAEGLEGVVDAQSVAAPVLPASISAMRARALA